MSCSWTRRAHPSGLLCLVVLVSCYLDVLAEFWTVTDVRNAIYEEQKFFGGCYKLLNNTGPVGCSAPTRDRARAPLIRAEDLPSPLTDDRAVLVGSLRANAFLEQLRQDAQLLQHVKAVLVYDNGTPDSDSAALAFPGGAEFAPYSAPGSPSTYVWNPFGSGYALTYLPVPVFQVTANLASDAVWRAQYNHENSFKGTSHWAEVELTMEASQPDSAACLAARTCQPVGGFSVWSAMPPLPINTTTGALTPNNKNVTVVVAGIDSTARFHDSVQAADAPMSGLLAMLAAMSILSASNQTATYQRQLVFTALAGEPWNYMGSKRLMWDLARGGTPFTAGLSLASIDQVVEVGPVGRALTNNKTRLYLHSQPSGSKWGDAAPLLSAIEGAANSSGDVNVTVQRASSSNPGIPPSSLFSFLRAKPAISGVVLTEFDTQFINPYYHSTYDNASTVQADTVVAAAVLLARTLHALAAPPGAPSLTINPLVVLNTVKSLAACLVLDSPGMSCPLATSLLNPDFQVTDQFVSYAVKHYVGVLEFIHPNPQEPFYKKTIYRFLWNYMGLQSAVGAQGSECAFAANQCPAGQACIGWKGSNRKNRQLMGRCWNTSVSYTPSVSARLEYIPSAVGYTEWTVSNASAQWEAAGGWPVDPLWAESNWPSSTPFVRIVQQDSSATEWSIFGGAVGACVLTGLLTFWGRSAFEQHLKAL